MIETHLNVFDATVFAIMALSCLFAFFRGFVREILSLGAWVGAGIVTIYFFPTVAELLKDKFKDPIVAAGFGTLGIYIGALIVFSMLNMMILKFLKSGSDVGMLDNMLGLAFGAFRGAFIISLGFFLITVVVAEKEYPKWIKESVTHPYAEKGAMMLVKVAPDYLKKISSLQKKMAAEGEDKKAFWKHLPKQEEEDTDQGYGRSNTNQLDRIIESK